MIGNARDIKAFIHKKTDKTDSKVIAKLTLKEKSSMILMGIISKKWKF
jgi:hypothetical protein